LFLSEKKKKKKKNEEEENGSILHGMARLTWKNIKSKSKGRFSGKKEEEEEEINEQKIRVKIRR
jgi:hypothetical protein